MIMDFYLIIMVIYFAYGTCNYTKNLNYCNIVHDKVTFINHYDHFFYHFLSCFDFLFIMNCSYKDFNLHIKIFFFHYFIKKYLFIPIIIFKQTTLERNSHCSGLIC